MLNNVLVEKYLKTISKDMKISIATNLSLELYGQILDDMVIFINDIEEDKVFYQQKGNKELIQILKDIYLMPISV